ncbi:MAG: prepilin-type N-terminal cleavage/methylation domain-containing protein, partial [Candidatus Gastranaerophilales bacterium]|nr:prepilin-type N-terminal cleavage/methylation domain-containing protein [Candidatus Gastranaerophilales bacterium]
MRNNKKGFTLSEVLVCLVIIGIIMVLSVNSIKIVRESYISLTYFAFKNLQAMVTELYAGSSQVLEGDAMKDEDGNTKISYENWTIDNQALQDSNGTYLPSMTKQCFDNNGNIIQVLKSDNEYNSYGEIISCSERQDYHETDGDGSNLFCKSLAAISNTSGKINCNDSDLANVSDVEENENGYWEPRIELNYDSPNFITTNGQRFYISSWQYDPEYISDEFGYRLVAIDLNSKSKPNITAVDNYKLPDIVTFLILDNGEIFPLGVAADNLTQNDRYYKYLNTKLKGYYYDANISRENSTTIPQECTRTVYQQDDNGNTTAVNNPCNYSVVPVQNSNGVTFFSYREAYCNAIDNDQLKYTHYCDGIDKHELCPPSNSNSAFDLCKVDTVKPMF